LAPPQKTAVIIGAGPAGLTAALEFCRRSAIHPIVLEASDRIGGISCTIRYHGNRIDIGGHRFFSKSDRVMEWWTRLMPIHGENADGAFAIRYQNKERVVRPGTLSPESTDSAPGERDPDLVMLVRPRKSRIYFLRSFFD
jgi:monoamine oxidase